MSPSLPQALADLEKKKVCVLFSCTQSSAKSKDL